MGQIPLQRQLSMANNTPVPDFVSGQSLLARDFAALVGAVRDLMHGQMPTLEQPRAGRYYRPFVIAGTCIPHTGAEDDEPVAGVAEVLFQVGENVSLCGDDVVGGLGAALTEAQDKGVACGLHGSVVWRFDGGIEGYTMWAERMVCEAVPWVVPVWSDDGSLGEEGVHGEVVWSVVMPTANTRGQLQCTPVPWVLPQCPAMVWRSTSGDVSAAGLIGEDAVLPAPSGGEQLITMTDATYLDREDGVYRRGFFEWRGRLDRNGVLHLMANSAVD